MGSERVGESWATKWATRVKQTGFEGFHAGIENVLREAREVGLTITDLERMSPEPVPSGRGDLHFDLCD